MAYAMTRQRTTSRRRQQVIIWVAGLIVTAVMLGLGLWQMQAFQQQGRDALIARMHEPPVEVLSVAPAGQEPGDSYGRTVRASGNYLIDQQLLIPIGDTGRFRVLTALQLSDGSVVGVVRGVSEGTNPPEPPAGEVVQLGVFLPSEGDAGSGLPPDQLGSVRLPLLAQMWDQPLVPGFINLDEAGATAQGMPPAQVTMPSGAGQARNQGYALQWWIFAVAAMAATIKLSRDASKGTGFMATAPAEAVAVDSAVDNPAKSADPSTEVPHETTRTSSANGSSVEADRGAVVPGRDVE